MLLGDASSILEKRENKTPDFYTIAARCSTL